MFEKKICHGLVCGSALGLVAGYFALSAPALAQNVTIENGAGSAGGANETVTVTGSRVTRAGFEAPTPVTVIGSDDFEKSGNANLADTLNDVPEVSGSLGASTQPASSTTVGQNYIALRNLGPQRTLVLMDGKRYTPSSFTGLESTNLIPQMLVNRVEVVTGGASAQWGSDAIAGVVNFVLNHDIEGVRANFQGGTTDYGDYQNYNISFAAGHSFLGGKAHVEIAGEVADNSGVGFMARDWLRAGWQTIANPNSTTATVSSSNPKNLVVADVRTTNAAYGGVINSGPLKGIQFGPGGVPIPFNYGSYVSTSTMVGGDGVNRDSLEQVASPISRQTGYAQFTYDFTPDLQGYLEVNYAHSLTSGPLTLPGSTYDAAITIQKDNGFLPASIVAAMTANKITSFSMGRWTTDYALNNIHFDVQTMRVGGGFKGGFGDGWTWDVNYSYGGTNNPVKVFNNRNTANYNLAIDAVVNTASGAIVCRSTLNNPGNGCVPLNLFGPNSASPSALAYVMGTSRKEYRMRRANAAATLNGTPFDTWAGPVSFAAGVEYRHDGLNVTADPIAVATGWGVASQIPYSGALTVWEGFSEVVVPLAKDEWWAKDVTVDLAARETGYSLTGVITTWKAGLNYAINDNVRFRANESHDYRVPALDALYAGGGSNAANVNDPFTGQSAVRIYNPTTGNPTLRPETANTTTVGIVLTPSFLPGFLVSVDYYDIQATGLIASVSAQAIVTNCYNYNIGCNLITRDSNGTIAQIPNTSTNLQSARTDGVDIEAEYRLADGELGWNEGWGDLTLHYTGNYLGLANYTQPGAAPTRDANRILYSSTLGFGGGPRWRFNLRATWDKGPYSISVTERFAGGGRNFDPQFTSLDYNILKTSNRLYTDLNFQYTLDASSLGSPVFFLGVRNLFDLDPPIATQSASLGVLPTQPGLYDVIGRRYMGGIKFNF